MLSEFIFQKHTKMLSDFIFQKYIEMVSESILQKYMKDAVQIYPLKLCRSVVVVLN